MSGEILDPTATGISAYAATFTIANIAVNGNPGPNDQLTIAYSSQSTQNGQTVTTTATFTAQFPAASFVSNTVNLTPTLFSVDPASMTSTGIIPDIITANKVTLDGATVTLFSAYKVSLVGDTVNGVQLLFNLPFVVNDVVNCCLGGPLKLTVSTSTTSAE